MSCWSDKSTPAGPFSVNFWSNRLFDLFPWSLGPSPWPPPTSPRPGRSTPQTPAGRSSRTCRPRADTSQSTSPGFLRDRSSTVRLNLIACPGDLMHFLFSSQDSVRRLLRSAVVRTVAVHEEQEGLGEGPHREHVGQVRIYICKCQVIRKNIAFLR